MGNIHSTGFSFGLADLKSDHVVRDRILSAAKKQEKQIRATTKSPDLRKKKIVELYGKANDIIQKAAKTKANRSGNRLYAWVKSGARGSWDQYRQMTVAPVLVVDSKGEAVPTPVDKAFSEGLDTGAYWASMYGARMGTIGRVKGTQEPGAMTKEMMQTSMNQMVVDEDCGTSRGLLMAPSDKNAVNRVLAVDVKLGLKGTKQKGTIPRGTVITPGVLSRLRNNKIRDITVRTPLKCEVEDGLCAKCFGVSETGSLHNKGVNLGVIAAHSLGEPLTQMAMDAFHTGGVASARETKKQDQFDRVTQLVRFPATLPGSATLATQEGPVQRVQKDKVTGGHNIFVGGQRHFVPADRGVPTVQVGLRVRKGDSLSHGPKNPLEMVKLTGVNSVQKYLTDELDKVYGGDKNGSNLHRRNAEVFVRALTNLSVIKDPGDHPEWMRGDRIPTTVASSWNRKAAQGKRQVRIEPVLKGTNVLPNEVQTDWLARLQFQDLKKTISDGASEGWFSNIHGAHPVPGMAYAQEFGKGTPSKPWLY
jgi:DNA-directed RNA polymerase subunit beta'